MKTGECFFLSRSIVFSSILSCFPSAGKPRKRKAADPLDVSRKSKKPKVAAEGTKRRKKTKQKIQFSIGARDSTGTGSSTQLVKRRSKWKASESTKLLEAFFVFVNAKGNPSGPRGGMPLLFFCVFCFLLH
jgi:hypothetical protein